MTKRPNILFLMSDQHNAGAAGFAESNVVRTPNLDSLAKSSVRFDRAYCNNPICAPSRTCTVTGLYPHNHGIFGNSNFELDDYNSATLGATLRRYGYQTALIGKAHMIRNWDNQAYEHIRYVDMADADRNDPRTCHYYKYLVDNGVADLYEDGTLPPDHENNIKGSAIAKLPYEHSNEHYTGEQSLEFLKERDTRRPFFLQMSFERPHPNWMPAAEYADLYAPEDIELGEDAKDWWENKWSGRPKIISDQVAALMEGRSEQEFKQMLARQYALITVIDMEIGRVLDYLRENGELENTIIVYTADHGDFAGDHGIINKNIGIYESIQRVPLLLSYPGCKQNSSSSAIVESIDVFPTLCELVDVPAPDCIDGQSIKPEAEGKSEGKARALCEWDFPDPQRFVNALRTQRYRLVYYNQKIGGELYDHDKDPYEMNNLWDDKNYSPARLELMEKLFDQINQYKRKTTFDDDARKAKENELSPTRLIHKKCRKWSDIASVAKLT